MISTVRLSQLTQNFLIDFVSKNEFAEENKELHQMIIDAIASSNDLSGHPNRSVSSWATRKEVYVFSYLGIEEHIMKYKFLVFIFLFNIELILSFLSSNQILYHT